MADSQLSPCGSIDLDSLATVVPAIFSPKSVGHFIETCMFCLDSQGHSSGIRMGVKTDSGDSCFNIFWKDSVTSDFYRRYGGNSGRTTDLGATAIALYVIRELTGYTAVYEASYGTTIDYLLGEGETDDTYIFDNVVAYCEIRGIRKERGRNTIKEALKEKLKRLKKPEDLPTFITVVEFGKPFTRVALV